MVAQAKVLTETGLFTDAGIEDAQAILRKKGVFTQTKIYRRGTALYAKQGSGYIRLLSKNATSNPDVTWVELHDLDHVQDSLGRLIIGKKVKLDG